MCEVIIRSSASLGNEYPFEFSNSGETLRPCRYGVRGVNALKTTGYWCVSFATLSCWGGQGEGELTIWRAVWAYVGGSNWVIAHPHLSKGGSVHVQFWVDTL